MSAMRFKKKRASLGFTFSETLVAVLIMTMMSGAMAVGVSFAEREYRRSILLSEGRMLSGSVSDIIRKELYTNSGILVEGDTVYFTYINGEQINKKNFALSDESVEGIPKGRLCLKESSDDGEWMPLLGGSAYSKRGLRLSNLRVEYEDSTGKDFGYGSFHVAFDVVETQTRTTVLHNDFYAMALNEIAREP